FATDWLTDRTIDFIQDEESTEPFLYMVSIPDPHGPDTVRAPYDSMYDDADVLKPRTFEKDPESAPSWAKPESKCHFKMAQYHGMMKCIDDNVGRLIAAMKEAGVYDNTIFIFTADHGDMRGEHHRQNKGVPLEASGKVPFVVRWPKMIPAGIQIDHAMNTTDFMPTILALCDVEGSGREQGRDLVGVFKGEKLKTKDVTFMRGTTKSADDSSGWIAAVTPTHKLILSSQDEAWLLNLEKDPDELVNAIDEPDEQETVKFLAQQLDRYKRKVKDAKLQNPNTRANLDALLG
ncbi:MAG: sulfatase-like hydrolase/transferase, partial [Verrucomicrobiota bacterium]